MKFGGGRRSQKKEESQENFRVPDADFPEDSRDVVLGI